MTSYNIIFNIWQKDVKRIEVIVLNAMIRLDTSTVMSDPYAHKCCKTLGVKSGAKHYKYKKPGNPCKIYPNLLMAEMQIDRPLQCVVSDMTAFYVKGIYYELTLYMDI